MKSNFKITLFRFALIAISLFSVNGRSDLFQDLRSFHSERLKFEFLKPEHYAGLESMFSQIDLHKMMGREGLTASVLKNIFKSEAEKLEQLGAGGGIKIEEPFLLIYGITLLSTGEFVGSATIQTLTKEAIAQKHPAFKEQEDKYGHLFAIGRSFMPLSQGVGYGKEACQAIVERFFRVTGDTPMAIISSSFKGNVASGKSIQNCGFEKFLEEKNKDGDEYFDIVHFIRAK